MIEPMINQFNDTYLPGKSKDIPTLPDKAGGELISALIDEELLELHEALTNNDIVEAADALTDIIYVTAQQARLWGFPIDDLLREVQRSNMSKLDENGQPILSDTGKVLKGPNFSEPEILKVLQRAGF